MQPWYIFLIVSTEFRKFLLQIKWVIQVIPGEPTRKISVAQFAWSMNDFKVACVVNIKLFFYGLILLQFDNTNNVMQNPIQKFRLSSIVFEKPCILSENLKNSTSSNYPTVQYSLLKLRTYFLFTNDYKRVCGIFFILFRS